MNPQTPVEQKKSRIRHPCGCRLGENAEFSTTSPKALVSAGFASFVVGIFTLFRMTPFFLLSFMFHVQVKSRILDMYKVIVLISMLVWLTLIGIVFFLFGFFLIISVKTKQRNLALAHPWGLLIIYFDVFFWTTVTVFLHYEAVQLESHKQITLEGIGSPLVFFLIIYFDLFFYFVIYWAYATYFIVAELTVIEKFF